jgi:OmpA-OmpF porin, OOP family
MKRLVWLLFLIYSLSSFSQNLVVNSSFEDHNVCERNVKCSPKGWYSTLHSSVTSYTSTKNAHSGKWVLGVYLLDSKSDKRSYVQTPLKCELKEGEPYFFEMFIKARKYASNIIGVYFSPTVIDTNTRKALNFKAQIKTPEKEMLYDKKEDWIKIEGTYTAKGGERFLVIGNFEEGAENKLKKVGKKMNRPKSFYYIDDVSLTSLNNLPLCDADIFVSQLYIDSLRHPYSPFIFNKQKIVGYIEKESKQIIDSTSSIDGNVKYDIGQVFVLKNVLFETAKSRLLPASHLELDKLVNLLKKFPLMIIELSGHTDNMGTVEYNLQLSKDRAQSVVDYLIKAGIKKERLYFSGYGSDKPITTNDTEKGRQLNRRVEFKIIKK